MLPGEAGSEFPRRKLFGRPIVVVTIVTRRLGRKLTVGVAVFAVELAMQLVECQPDIRMLEVFLVPAGVTAAAMIVERSDLFPGRMAGAAVKRLVIRVQ